MSRWRQTGSFPNSRAGDTAAYDSLADSCGERPIVCSRCGEEIGGEEPDGCRDYFCPAGEDADEWDNDDQLRWEYEMETEKQKAAQYHKDEEAVEQEMKDEP